MCIPSPKMPDVKVPATSAPAAPAAAPPDMQTDFTDTDKNSQKTQKKAKGKKNLRYKVSSGNNSSGLQIPTTGSNTKNLKAQKMAQAKYMKNKSEAQVKKELPKKGRGGDSVLGHLTPGEMVVPNALLDAEGKAFRNMLSEIMEEYGINPKEYTVGDKANKINPETGYPEFWGFSSFFKPVTKVVKTVTKAVKNVAKAVVKPVKQVAKTATKIVQKAVKAVAKPVAKGLGIQTEAPAAKEVVTPSTGAAASEYIQDPSGKAKKSYALRRKRRGKRRLRVAGDVGIGTSGQGSGVGTGGSSGGSSINVPRG